MLFRDPIPDADYRHRWVDRLPKKPKGLEKTRGRGRMMMRLLIVIAALVASLVAIAGETPTQFMERYVGYFNAENLEQYQTAFKFPVIRSTGGVLEILSDPTAPMANFENIKKTGWVTSRVDSIKVLAQSPQAAMVEFSFSRINSSGNPFFESTGHYGLVNTDNGWKIQSIFFVNPITVGTD